MGEVVLEKGLGGRVRQLRRHQHGAGACAVLGVVVLDHGNHQYMMRVRGKERAVSS